MLIALVVYLLVALLTFAILLEAGVNARHRMREWKILTLLAVAALAWPVIWLITGWFWLEDASALAKTRG